MESTKSRGSEPREEARYVLPLQVLGLASVYAASGWLGLQLAQYQQNATLLWPPTGIALAALLVWGRRVWIGIWLGAFVLNQLNGLPLTASLEIATGNLLMPLVGALLLVHVFDFRPTLERVRDIVVLALVGGALPAMVSSGIGVAALWLAEIVPTSEVGPVISLWWRGDLLGVIAFAPPLLLLRRDDPEWRRLFRDFRFWMMAGLGVLLLVLGFSGLVLPLEWENIPVRLTIPYLLWVAVSLGMRATTLLYIVILVPMVTATYLNLGPLLRFGPSYATEQLWVYLMVAGCVPLAVAALVRQLDEARVQQKLEASERTRIEREQSVTMERDRVLREMHDGIGGQLTSILSMVQRGAATNEEIGAALRRTLDDMRIMIDSLEASDAGLLMMIGRLRARLEPVLRRNGLRASWKIEAQDALDHFDPTRALHVLRIIQEAIANVVQYAHATRIEIRVVVTDPSDGILTMEVVDNGIGPKPGSTGMGRGIRNMTTRAQALDAELRFEVRESGYAVSLLVPVPMPG